ncbi:hypothetical protein EES39_05045 [Streptomyces sp. ADI92-24]|nr:hypothetical protein EES39_05045 [Streptomyces sp. ADI92-24]
MSVYVLPVMPKVKSWKFWPLTRTLPDFTVGGPADRRTGGPAGLPATAYVTVHFVPGTVVKLCDTDPALTPLRSSDWSPSAL